MPYADPKKRREANARAEAKRAQSEDQILLRLPIAEVAEIRRVAQERGVSVKQLIRDAIQASLLKSAN